MKTLLYISLLLIAITSGCFVKPSDAIIKIKGSDTMLILNRLWAEEYMKSHPDVSIYFEGGGTEEGIKALIDGEVDIAAASRPIDPVEVKKLARKYRSVGMSFTVGKDALSIYLNLENPVENLTVAQVKEIFTGKITNWKDVGGDNEKIELISRPPNSGSYYYFKEHVLDDAEYSAGAKILPTTELIVKEVIKNKNAVGYGGIAYSNAVVDCSINGVVPTIENVQNNTYAIIRYLLLYTVDMPDGELKRYLDWIVSPAGQQIVKKAGYIPLW
jgi:phosphate transport system substrate-binding protein